jgi:uncharacterized protein YyaL (SSP411 family)
MSSPIPRFTNALIDSTSPYLLQHAHNPVNWFPWGEEAIEKAKSENKPLLISIGYSACHWCHVMEHESFEDEETAAIMNAHFVCVKVDREERPDIDQLYMAAVQLMTKRGGWPLNCFALPDGRPIYGGTYFPKEQWQHVMHQIQELCVKDRPQVEEYARNLTQGIEQTELFKVRAGVESISKADLQQSVGKWMGIIDQEEGGPNRAPKFPLPNNYQFLMRWAVLANQKHVLDHVHLTLKKMAFGGIYDQVGGGFSRYSTDVWWKVPHFEKMLYDNGQLLSLYAEAFLQNGDADYKQVCINTADFIQRELTAEQGYFFSALDADSEGVEGKFYVWTIAELKNILNEKEFRIACSYYNINEFGYWEHENYILIRREENRIVCEILEIHEEELDSNINSINSKLLNARSERIRPGLDDKLLCSWNAMCIRGLADLSIALDDFEYYEQAKKAALFILKELKDFNGRLWHTWKNGKASVPGFLEDYAFLIDALIGLYQASFESQWLFEARDLLYTVFDDFERSESGLFYFTSSQHGVWVARQLETSDNVQPASNSMMARNLNTLGIFLEKSEWILQCDKMLRNVREELINYGAGYSNWAMLALERVSDFKTLVICGPGAKDAARELQKSHRPDLIMAASENENLLPLFEGRTTVNQLTYFVCRGSHCEAPVYDESKLKI